jgi:hypothetical protein
MCCVGCSEDPLASYFHELKLKIARCRGSDGITISALSFCFFVVQALFISCLCSQVTLLDVMASCLILFPLFLTVVGTVVANLSCFVLPLPSHPLFVRLSVRVSPMKGVHTLV